jgi:peptidyl-prolyl cis-trans isomerase SurA
LLDFAVLAYLSPPFSRSARRSAPPVERQPVEMRVPISLLTRPTTRAGALLLAAAALGLNAGCAGRALQADNPVLGSTPPRKHVAVAAQTADVGSARFASSDIEQASFDDPEGVHPPLSQDIGGVAATVNGTPILVADVLERFTPQLKAAEQQVSPAEFASLKRQLIERELPAHIEQAILVDSAMSQVSAEQKKLIEEQLKKFFAEHLAQMQAEMGVKSLAELEAVFQQHGTSITTMQRSFNNRQLAGQAMGMLQPKEPTITRREILREYQSRLEEFTEPEKVRWQQIWISYKKHGGKQQAFEALDAVIRELKAGRPFEDVAREHSDGVMAAEGGQWDWTQRGELSNPQIERMLFELPVGEIGQVVAGETAFQLVRVTERRPQTTKTFAEMQNQLGQEIKERKQQKLLDEVLAELKQKAVVTTMFDGESEARR